MTAPKQYRTLAHIAFTVKEIDVKYPGITPFVEMCQDLGLTFREGNRTRPDSSFYTHKEVTVEFYTLHQLRQFSQILAGTRLGKIKKVQKLLQQFI